MSISEKIKATNNKIEQSKAKYDFDRQAAEIQALKSANGSKYEFLIGKDIFPDRDLLKKAVAMERFEYSKTQTDNAKKEYQKLVNTYQLK